jgi:hypothetical protein
MFKKSLLAASLLGMTAYGAASAARPAPQPGLDTNGGLVTLAQVKITNPNVVKQFPKGPPVKLTNPNIPKYFPKTPSPKGGGHHHWSNFGGVVVVGTSYCAARAEWCADRYGARTYRFVRCLRNVGC